MTQEDKELLLKDLCARLPYGVICKYDCVTAYDDVVIKRGNSTGKLIGIKPVFDGQIGFMVNCDVVNALSDNIKPYLRPMSSMTEEESAELSNIISEWYDKELFTLTEEPMIEFALSRLNYSINPILFNWLLKNHFDFIGLIPKGLALEAKEGMYKKGE